MNRSLGMGILTDKSRRVNMSNEQVSLELEVIGSGSKITLENFSAYVAGYTGRKTADVQAHIDELAEIGVAPPPRIPMFYPVDSNSVTTKPTLNASGSKTSGEVEPLYIRHRGEYYVGVASDHTDRELETEDIGRSKQVCPKPIATQVIKVTELESFSLDSAIVRCWVDDQLYQEGARDGLLRPHEVITKLLNAYDLGDSDFVCLGGTLPLKTETFVYGTAWALELHTHDQAITHTYTIEKDSRK